MTLPPQAGPSKTPTVDVFGDWRVIDHLGGLFVTGGSSEWPEKESLREQCIAKAPDPQATRDKYIFDSPYPASHFPALRPIPAGPKADSHR